MSLLQNKKVLNIPSEGYVTRFLFSTFNHTDKQKCLNLIKTKKTEMYINKIVYL